MHPDEIELHHKLEEPIVKPQPYLIKEHKVGELVNEVTRIANKYAGCQCMRSVIHEAITEALKK